MSYVCVNGAQVQLQPLGSQQLSPPSSIIPARAQSVLAVDGRAALVPADIQAWAASYTAAYANPPYVGGQVQGSTVQVSGLAAATSTMGQMVVLQGTQVVLTVNVTAKAKDPATGSEDTVSQFPVQVIFADTGQVKVVST